MPTAQDLDRLRAAMATLSSLSAARGDLIKAEDWNSLVGIVVELGRTVLGRDAAETVPPHEHLDQVTADWLSPPLRDQVERGPLADPAQSLRISKLELQVQRVHERFDNQQGASEDLAARFDGVVTRDVERQAAMTRLTRQVETVTDPAPQIDAMRASLQSVQDNIGKVLNTSARLNDATGAPIDLGALDGRVKALDQLASRLRDANGEVLDFAGLENRLADIANKSVTQDQLTKAIRNAANTRPVNLDQVATNLSTDLQTRFEASLGNLKSELDATVNTRLAGLDGLVDARVANALPAVSAGITNSLDARIAQARDATIAAAGTAAARDLATQAEALRSEFAAHLASTTETVRGFVQSEVSSRIANDLQAAAQGLATANQRIDAFANDVAALKSDRASFTASIAAVPQQLAALRAELRDTLVTEATTRANATLTAVNARLDNLSTQQQQMLTSIQRQVTQSAIDAARTAASEAAQSQVTAARVSILSEARGIAREEIGVASKLRTTSAGSLGQANPGLGQIAGLGTVIGPR